MELVITNFFHFSIDSQSILHLLLSEEIISFHFTSYLFSSSKYRLNSFLGVARGFQGFFFNERYKRFFPVKSYTQILSKE